MSALGSSETLSLRTPNGALILAPINRWGPGDLSRVSGRPAAELFASLWLDQSAVDDLRRFWRRVSPLPSAPARPLSGADVKSQVAAALRSGHLGLEAPETGVTAAQIRAIMTVPAVRNADLAAVLAPLNSAMTTYGINTAPRRAAFLAQIAVESASLSTLEENLNYRTFKALHGSWPKLFPDERSIAPYVGHPQKLANYVYAKRNGNRGGSDGWDFRGRGYIQITGRDGYRAVGYELTPDELIKPAIAAETSAHWWSLHGLGVNKLPAMTAAWLTRNQFDQVTLVVNGPRKSQAEERWQAYQRGRKALGG